MSVELIIQGIALVLLLGASAFFSGSETALFSLRDVELEEMARRTERGPRHAVRLARDSNRTLVTLLVANMVVNVLISVLTTSVCLRLYGPAGLGVAIPVATILLLLFGEIVPKSMGLRRGRPWAEAAAPVVALLAWLLGPVRRGLEMLARAVTGPPSSHPLQRDELGTLLSVVEAEGEITPFERRVLRRILQFADTPVERILTPRVDMVAVHFDADFPTMVDLFEKSGRSRLPVYDEHREHVVGVLLLKDLFTYDGDRERVRARELMREPFFVPENLGAAALFREFQTQRVHIAVAVGEHGGVEGLVTLEDLLEEIVGDIRDESDEEDLVREQVAPGRWHLDAATELDDLAEMLGVEEPRPTEAVTISGLLQDGLGRVPVAGDHLEWERGEIHVLRASATRALLVELRWPPDVEGER